MEHVDGVLAELALGLLPPEETAAVDAHVGDCESCARELREVYETLSGAAVAAGNLPPPTWVKSAVLDAIGDPPCPVGFASRLSRLFDWPEATALGALRGLGGGGALWQPALPGVEALHFEGGPAVADADVGFVRYQAGLIVPRHVHLGEERMLVLSGSFRVERRAYQPGDLLVSAPGSAHSLAIDPSEDCVCALVLRVGVDFLQ
jgi:anti-sigma factor ChrR (cupin superfamily)